MASTLSKVRELEGPKVRGVDIAAITGLSRGRVSNCLRVVRLSRPLWLSWIEQGRLSQKHVEAVLKLPGDEAEELLRMAMARRWSYNRLLDAIKAKRKGRTLDGDSKDANLLRLEGRLSEMLGTAVRIDVRPDGSGEMVMSFHDADTLEGLLERVGYRED